MNKTPSIFVVFECILLRIGKIFCISNTSRTPTQRIDYKIIEQKVKTIFLRNYIQFFVPFYMQAIRQRCCENSGAMRSLRTNSTAVLYNFITARITAVESTNVNAI